jgi:hypothetical protein
LQHFSRHSSAATSLRVRVQAMRGYLTDPKLRLTSRLTLHPRKEPAKVASRSLKRQGTDITGRRSITATALDNYTPFFLLNTCTWTSSPVITRCRLPLNISGNTCTHTYKLNLRTYGNLERSTFEVSNREPTGEHPTWQHVESSRFWKVLKPVKQTTAATPNDEDGITSVKTNLPTIHG